MIAIWGCSVDTMLRGVSAMVVPPSWALSVYWPAGELISAARFERVGGAGRQAGGIEGAKAPGRRWHGDGLPVVDATFLIQTPTNTGGRWQRRADRKTRVLLRCNTITYADGRLWTGQTHPDSVGSNPTEGTVVPLRCSFVMRAGDPDVGVGTYSQPIVNFRHIPSCALI
jgi:hypothetical protein